MFTLQGQNGRTKWAEDVDRELSPFNPSPASVGRTMSTFIFQQIAEMNTREGFDCLDLLALEMLFKDAVHISIGLALSDFMHTRWSGGGVDVTPLTAESVERVEGAIFWGNGLLSVLESEVVIARVRDAIGRCPNQQPIHAESKEDYDELKAYEDEMNERNHQFALNVLNDLSHTIFGVGCTLNQPTEQGVTDHE